MKKGGTFSWNPNSTVHTDSSINKYTLVYYNQKPLEYIEYDVWILNTPYPTRYPEVFTIVPESGSLIFNPADDWYTIGYRAVCSPETLTENIQIPKIPSRYRRAIVYKAAASVGHFLGNEDVFNLNTTRYDMMIASLLRNQNTPKRIRQRPIA
jgi:hypothetical protein